MQSWALRNIRQQRKGNSMTSIKTVSAAAFTDHLPRPCATSDQDNSATGLTMPKPAMPDIIDSGRISFGAACRIPTVR